MKEKTNTFTIKTMDGEEQEITIHALTMRHANSFSGTIERSEIPSILFDLMAPGTLDIISPESYAELLEHLMDESSDFFIRVAKTLTAIQKATEKRHRAIKSSSRKSN